MSIAELLGPLHEAFGDRVQAGEPLARHTTFRIGGPADLLVEAQTVAELVECVRLARQYEVPSFILGNGSNLLVLDGGIRGLVVKNGCKDVRLKVTAADQAILQVDSGAALPLVANQMSRQGWSGLEWAIGVPGTIGGAVAGNAGAHGSCMADNLLTATVLDETGQTAELPKSQMGFGYRSSRFKRTPAQVILAASLELRHADPPTCIERMAKYREQRRRTQPTDPSVGSIFKNPAGDYAGRLIEQAGMKGTRVGNVEVSTVHGNFIVNRGGAMAEDVMALIAEVRERVRERTGIVLELEIEIVGMHV